MYSLYALQLETQRKGVSFDHLLQIALTAALSKLYFELVVSADELLLLHFG